MYPQRGRASGDEEREGGLMADLDKQPFVCPDFCLGVTSTALQQRVRGWASGTDSPVLGQKFNISLPAGNNSLIPGLMRRCLLKGQRVTPRAREEERSCGRTVSSACGVWAGWGNGKEQFCAVAQPEKHFAFGGQEQAYSTISCSTLIFDFGILSSFLKLTS